MSARLRDERSEVDHHVFPNQIGGVLGIGRLPGQVFLRLLDQKRIEVFSVVAQLGQPREVIDPGAFPFQFVEGNPGADGHHVAAGLDGMAKAHDLKGRCASRRKAKHAHGIGVVQHDRLRGDRLHILQDLEPDRDRPQGFEESSRPNGVADALVDAVPGGNIVVEADAGHAGDLDAVDDVVGILEHLFPVFRGDDFPVSRAFLFQQFLDQLVHGPEPMTVDIHEGDQAALAAGDADHVGNQPGSETAAGAEHRNLDRAFHFARERMLAGFLGVLCVTRRFFCAFIWHKSDGKDSCELVSWMLMA